MKRRVAVLGGLVVLVLVALLLWLASLEDPREMAPRAARVATVDDATPADAPRERRHAAPDTANADDTSDQVDKPAPVVTRALTIHVVREDGGSTAGARIHVATEDAVVRARAADDGRVTVDVPGPPHAALATVPGHPTASLALDGTETEIELRVASGGTVSGVIRVDGGAPRTPLRLHLSLDELAGFWDQLPNKTRVRLRADVDVSPWGVGATTDATGSFQFGGLPAGLDRAMLQWGERHRLASGEASLDVDVPSRDLVVELVRVGFVTGRLLQPGSTRPGIGSRAVVTFRSSDPEQSDGATQMQSSSFVGPTGLFEFALPPWSAYTIELEAGGPNGSIRVEPFDPPPASEDAALGDLELVPAQMVTLHVSDLAGTPLPGAVAILGAQAHRLYAVVGGPPRSNAAGVIEARVPLLPATLRVAAVGFASQDVRVDGPGPHLVRLEPAPILRVLVHGPEAGVYLHLTDGSGDAFAPSEDTALVAAGATRIHTSTTLERWYQGWSAAKIVLTGLRADAPFTIVAHDRLGTVIDRKELRLGPGEDRSIVLNCARMGPDVEGRVTDDAGEPIAGARVVAMDAAGHTGRELMHHIQTVAVETDADGRFTLSEVRTKELQVVVSDERHQPFVARRVPATSEGLQFRLQPGRSVRVRQVDSASSSLAPLDGSEFMEVRVVDPQPASVLADASVWAQTQTDDGVEITNLPLGPVTLEVLRYPTEDVRTVVVAAGATEVTVSFDD